MRKQTKLVAVTSAAALLAIGASMTSFAATGWVEEGGQWYFYDKDGVTVENEWKKSGDNWYWLDSDEGGAMAIDKLVEDGENIYYVDTTGTMVSNTWVKVVNEEQDDDDPAEYNYYYMQSNGKAYKGGDNTSLKTIDGKRYAFDADGKMLYGWVGNDSNRVTGDGGWAEENEDMRFFGSWDDGAMKTGWQKIYVTDDDEDKDLWFYFNSNGKRFANKTSDGKNTKTKKLNGKTYAFDNRGVMVSQWALASDSDKPGTPSSWSYFNSPEDGARVTKGWFKVIPPTEDTTFTANITDANSFDSDGADDESNNWYYADGSGNLYAGAIKKIKGKYYAFSEKGKMLSGLVLIDVEDTGDIKVIDDGVDSDDLDALMNDKYKKDGALVTIGSASLYYFGNDADSDGAMKTGSTTITLDGDSYNFMFSKSGGVENKGKGQTGIDDKKYIYKYGKRIKADSDDKYAVVEVSLVDGEVGTVSDEGVEVTIRDSKDFRLGADLTPDKNNGGKGEAIKVYDGFERNYRLVNSSGSIVRRKSAAKDGADWFFYVKEYEIQMYTTDKDLPESLKGWDK